MTDAKYRHVRLKDPPCDTCQERIRCRAELLACAAFKSFVSRARFRLKETAYVPSREIYDVIHRND